MYPYVLRGLKPRALPYPVLALWAVRGLYPRAEDFRLVELFPGTEARAQVLPGLTHLDLLTEREGRTAGLILRYLQDLGLLGPGGPP